MVLRMRGSAMDDDDKDYDDVGVFIIFIIAVEPVSIFNILEVNPSPQEARFSLLYPWLLGAGF